MMPSQPRLPAYIMTLFVRQRRGGAHICAREQPTWGSHGRPAAVHAQAHLQAQRILLLSVQSQRQLTYLALQGVALPLGLPHLHSNGRHHTLPGLRAFACGACLATLFVLTFGRRMACKRPRHSMQCLNVSMWVAMVGHQRCWAARKPQAGSQVAKIIYPTSSATGQEAKRSVDVAWLAGHSPGLGCNSPLLGAALIIDALSLPARPSHAAAHSSASPEHLTGCTCPSGHPPVL